MVVSENKGRCSVEELKFVKLCWPWLKNWAFRWMIILSSVWRSPKWDIKATILLMENFVIVPAISCMLCTRTTNWAKPPCLIDTSTLKILPYDTPKIYHIYSITLNQYLFHHLLSSINQTQSPTTYQNITGLIIHSPEITHHFYPDIIHIHSYLHFRIHTNN